MGYGVIGGAGIGLGYVTPVATAAKWFPDRKGLVTGIVVMGFGVGAFLLSKGLAPVLVVRAQNDLRLVFLWLGIVFFFNIAAGISVISFQSELLQEVWGLADPSIGPARLAEYGATLIAVSSLCNGVGRLFWGLLSDRLGRVSVFRILLASQMVVFGILMTETNPWIFSALVCYVLLCFGGGFATMPSFIVDVFGAKNMSKIFSYRLDDSRIRLGRPTLKATLVQYGIPVPGKG